MPLIEEIVARHDTLARWRHDIHAHPELGFEERRTADFVAKKLEEFGLEVHRGIGKTGVVGVLPVGNETASVGLRADMDALPISNRSVVPVWGGGFQRLSERFQSFLSGRSQMSFRGLSNRLCRS